MHNAVLIAPLPERTLIAAAKYDNRNGVRKEAAGLCIGSLKKRSAAVLRDDNSFTKLLGNGSLRRLADGFLEFVVGLQVFKLRL